MSRVGLGYVRGPGGGVYAVSIAIHLDLGTGATAALVEGSVVTNGLVVFGAGAVDPVVVKKVGALVERLLSGELNELGDRGGGGMKRLVCVL